MTDRRDFLRTLTLAAAATACGAPRSDSPAGDSAQPAQPAPAGQPASRGTASVDRVGVQLYTLRSALEKDLDGTLARVAAIGYSEVETAGFHGKSAAEFRRILDAHGLRAPSAHIPLGDIRDKTDATLADATAIGAQYVVLPWLEPGQRTMETYRSVVDVLNRVGQSAKRAGLRMAYHNHDFELETVEGVRPLDMLLERTDPELVSFELDLYWVTKAGADPLDYFTRFPGRFHMVHVKDSAGPPAHEMTDVGRGSIDFGRIFARREQAGIRHYFVEHDNPADPLASIATSYAALRALRF